MRFTGVHAEAREHNITQGFYERRREPTVEKACHQLLASGMTGKWIVFDPAYQMNFLIFHIIFVVKVSFRRFHKEGILHTVAIRDILSYQVTLFT